MRKHRIAAAALVVVALAGTSAIALAQEAAPDVPPPAPKVTKPDCQGQKSLAAKAYDTYRWWSTADPTPATKREARRLEAFVKDGCPASIRREAKARYAKFYRQVIAPCEAAGSRWANCAVAECESGYGSGGSSIYGLTVYWSAMSPLPVRGNGSGTRFSPSSFSATKLEQDVVMAAALRYGPTPATCAS